MPEADSMEKMDQMRRDSEKATETIISFEKYIKGVLEYNPYADVQIIKKAYEFAKKSHEGQVRASGEPFFVHPLHTAIILTELKADSATICAALLHDCVEDATVAVETIRKEFGEEIANLVEGLTKIQGIWFESKEEYKAENLRKVLLATTKDIRVMLIKLADRLHNMRTLKHFKNEEKRKRIAQETLDIFAPIAHKLGIRFIKGELEDLSLKELDPRGYQLIRNSIAEKREEREKKTHMFIRAIIQALKKHDIEAEVYGRAKYFYSIYQKMKKENKDFDDIYDLFAIRIIVKTIAECYAALGIVHELYKPMPKRFKDYISVPKANGYQSLHTSVVGDHGKILEIQIRTIEMHHIAEEGIAAHWRYKGTERDKKFDRRMSWLKQLLEWKQDSSSAKEFVESLKIDLFENEIVVFTPKGDPITLPEKSTPVDFAYAVHSNVGDKCSKAEVNGKIVPMDHVLNSGDIVHIVTQNNAKPSRAWLGFVKSSKARSKIRAALNIKEENVRSPGKAGDEKKEIINPLSMIEIVGKPAPLKISKCCDPQYKDEVVGFYTKDKKITVHKVDCPNIHALGQNKKVEVQWKERKDEGTVKLKVTVKDKVGLLADMLNVISNAKINVRSINTRTKKDRITITFKLKVPKTSDYNYVVSKIRGMKEVIDIRK